MVIYEREDAHTGIGGSRRRKYAFRRVKIRTARDGFLSYWHFILIENFREKGIKFFFIFCKKLEKTLDSNTIGEIALENTFKK